MPHGSRLLTVPGLLVAGLLVLGLGGAARQMNPPQQFFAAQQGQDPRPNLPFPDNADASQCGLPTLLGNAYTGTLTGVYQGTLTEPQVRLYDSHARARVLAQIQAGTRVRALLLVAGPQLDYLLVRAVMDGKTLEGWVPAPYFQADARTREF